MDDGSMALRALRLGITGQGGNNRRQREATIPAPRGMWGLRQTAGSEGTAYADLCSGRTTGNRPELVKISGETLPGGQSPCGWIRS